jgi:hypothetical protein
MKKSIASENPHRAEIRLTPIHYHRSPETKTSPQVFAPAQFGDDWSEPLSTEIKQK